MPTPPPPSATPEEKAAAQRKFDELFGKKEEVAPPPPPPAPVPDAKPLAPPVQAKTPTPPPPNKKSEAPDTSAELRALRQEELRTGRTVGGAPPPQNTTTERKENTPQSVLRDVALTTSPTSEEELQRLKAEAERQEFETSSFRGGGKPPTREEWVNLQAASIEDFSEAAKKRLSDDYDWRMRKGESITWDVPAREELRARTKDARYHQSEVQIPASANELADRILASVPGEKQNSEFFTQYRDYLAKQRGVDEGNLSQAERDVILRGASDDSRATLVALRTTRSDYWPQAIRPEDVGATREGVMGGVIPPGSEAAAQKLLGAGLPGGEYPSMEEVLQGLAYIVTPQSTLTPSGKSLVGEGAAEYLINRVMLASVPVTQAFRRLVLRESQEEASQTPVFGASTLEQVTKGDSPLVRGIRESDGLTSNVAMAGLIGMAATLDILTPGLNEFLPAAKVANVVEDAAKAADDAVKAGRGVQDAVAAAQHSVGRDAWDIADDLERQGKKAEAQILRDRMRESLSQTPEGRVVLARLEGRDIREDVAALPEYIDAKTREEKARKAYNEARTDVRTAAKAGDPVPHTQEQLGVMKAELDEATAQVKGVRAAAEDANLTRFVDDNQDLIRERSSEQAIGSILGDAAKVDVPVREPVVKQPTPKVAVTEAAVPPPTRQDLPKVKAAVLSSLTDPAVDTAAVLRKMRQTDPAYADRLAQDILRDLNLPPTGATNPVEEYAAQRKLLTDTSAMEVRISQMRGALREFEEAVKSLPKDTDSVVAEQIRQGLGRAKADYKKALGVSRVPSKSPEYVVALRDAGAELAAAKRALDRATTQDNKTGLRMLIEQARQEKANLQKLKEATKAQAVAEAEQAAAAAKAKLVSLQEALRAKPARARLDPVYEKELIAARARVREAEILHSRATKAELVEQMRGTRDALKEAKAALGEAQAQERLRQVAEAEARVQEATRAAAAPVQPKVDGGYRKEVLQAEQQVRSLEVALKRADKGVDRQTAQKLVDDLAAARQRVAAAREAEKVRITKVIETLQAQRPVKAKLDPGYLKRVREAKTGVRRADAALRQATAQDVREADRALATELREARAELAKLEKAKPPVKPDEGHLQAVAGVEQRLQEARKAVAQKGGGQKALADAQKAMADAEGNLRVLEQQAAARTTERSVVAPEVLLPTTPPSSVVAAADTPWMVREFRGWDYTAPRSAPPLDTTSRAFVDGLDNYLKREYAKTGFAASAYLDTTNAGYAKYLAEQAGAPVPTVTNGSVTTWTNTASNAVKVGNIVPTQNGEKLWAAMDQIAVARPDAPEARSLGAFLKSEYAFYLPDGKPAEVIRVGDRVGLTVAFGGDVDAYVPKSVRVTWPDGTTRMEVRPMKLQPGEQADLFAKVTGQGEGGEELAAAAEEAAAVAEGEARAATKRVTEAQARVAKVKTPKLQAAAKNALAEAEAAAGQAKTAAAQIREQAVQMRATTDADAWVEVTLFGCDPGNAYQPKAVATQVVDAGDIRFHNRPLRTGETPLVATTASYGPDKAPKGLRPPPRPTLGDFDYRAPVGNQGTKPVKPTEPAEIDRARAALEEARTRRDALLPGDAEDVKAVEAELKALQANPPPPVEDPAVAGLKHRIQGLADRLAKPEKAPGLSVADAEKALKVAQDELKALEEAPVQAGEDPLTAAIAAEKAKLANPSNEEVLALEEAAAKIEETIRGLRKPAEPAGDPAEIQRLLADAKAELKTLQDNPRYAQTPPAKEALVEARLELARVRKSPVADTDEVDQLRFEVATLEAEVGAYAQAAAKQKGVTVEEAAAQLQEARRVLVATEENPVYFGESADMTQARADLEAARGGVKAARSSTPMSPDIQTAEDRLAGILQDVADEQRAALTPVLSREAAEAGVAGATDKVRRLRGERLGVYMDNLRTALRSGQSDLDRYYRLRGSTYHIPPAVGDEVKATADELRRQELLRDVYARDATQPIAAQVDEVIDLPQSQRVVTGEPSVTPVPPGVPETWVNTAGKEKGTFQELPVSTPQELGEEYKLLSEGIRAANRSPLQARLEEVAERWSTWMRPARETAQDSIRGTKGTDIQKAVDDSVAMEAAQDREVIEALRGGRRPEVVGAEDYQTALRDGLVDPRLLDTLVTAYVDQSRLPGDTWKEVLREVVRNNAEKGWLATQDALYVASVDATRGSQALRNRKLGDAVATKLQGTIATHARVLWDLRAKTEGMAILTKRQADAAADWLSGSVLSAEGRRAVLSADIKPMAYKPEIRSGWDLTPRDARAILPERANPFAQYPTMKPIADKLRQVQGVLDDPQVYLPRALRDAFGRQADAATQTAKLERGVAGTLLGYWKQSLTQGVGIHRAVYFVDNIFGDFSQMAASFGLGVALRQTTRNLLQNAAIFPGIAQAAEISGRLARMGTGEGAQALGDVLAIGAIANGASDVLRAGPGSVVLGGKTYTAKELYAVAAKQGVLETHTSAELMGDLEMALNGQRFANPFAANSAALRAVSEQIQVRQRVGLMLTLINEGMDPVTAAKATTRALLDYQGALHPLDRNMIVGLFAPFWNFKKNNLQRAYRVLLTRQGSRNALRAHNAMQATAQTLTYLLDNRDSAGFDTEAMTEDNPEVHARYQEALRRVKATGLTEYEIKKLISSGNSKSLNDPELEMLSVTYFNADPIESMVPDFYSKRIKVWNQLRRTEAMRDYLLRGSGKTSKPGDDAQVVYLAEDTNTQPITFALAGVGLMANLASIAMRGQDPAAVDRAQRNVLELVGDPLTNPITAIVAQAIGAPLPDRPDVELPPMVGEFFRNNFGHLGRALVTTSLREGAPQTATTEGTTKDGYYMGALSKTLLDMTGTTSTLATLAQVVPRIIDPQAPQVPEGLSKGTLGAYGFRSGYISPIREGSFIDAATDEAMASVIPPKNSQREQLPEPETLARRELEGALAEPMTYNQIALRTLTLGRNIKQATVRAEDILWARVVLQKDHAVSPELLNRMSDGDVIREYSRLTGLDAPK